MFRSMTAGAPRRRLAASVTCSLALVLGLLAAEPARADPPSDGRIVFIQHDWRRDTRTVFLVDPDGTNLQQLTPWRSEFLEPTWSPDGSELDIAGDACGVIHELYCSAVIVDPDTGAYRWLPAEKVFFDCVDPCYIGGFGCPIWSRDGTQLACQGASVGEPGRSGIYTERSSDGGDLTKVLSFDPSKKWEVLPQPKDFSPDGNRLLYEQAAGVHRSGLFSVNLDGTDKRRVSPEGLVLDHDDAATYAPSGEWILFTAFPKSNHRKTIYLVHPDGSGLHEVFPECGDSLSKPQAIGCKSASWSPDGSRIVYWRSAPNAEGTYVNKILNVNVDGTDPAVVVRSRPGIPIDPEFPYWGTHPSVP